MVGVDREVPSGDLVGERLSSSYILAWPLMTSFTNFKAWIANASMFCSRSVPLPVSRSILLVPDSLATANATYPLSNVSDDLPQGFAIFRGSTYGVLFGVEPPVGPAVPLCHIC